MEFILLRRSDGHNSVGAIVEELLAGVTYPCQFVEERRSSIQTGGGGKLRRLLIRRRSRRIIERLIGKRNVLLLFRIFCLILPYSSKLVSECFGI